MRAALFQMTASDVPCSNVEALRAAAVEAKSAGADMLFTPEVSNCLSTSRSHQQAVLTSEQEDLAVRAMKEAARELDLWIMLGSVALNEGYEDGRFANRSLVISPSGEIAARYDKIHMFDVEVSPEETYRESAAYRPGDRAVICDCPLVQIGMTICYDLRFAHLHRKLAQAGAQIITVPAAFSYVTGAAHWEVLLRARAIETGCFIVAPAQTGHHPAQKGASRQTYGHSIVVAPWGEVLLDAGREVGLFVCDLDLDAVEDARRRVPAITTEPVFEGPSHHAR